MNTRVRLLAALGVGCGPGCVCLDRLAASLSDTQVDLLTNMANGKNRILSAAVLDVELEQFAHGVPPRQTAPHPTIEEMLADMIAGLGYRVQVVTPTNKDAGGRSNRNGSSRSRSRHAMADAE